MSRVTTMANDVLTSEQHVPVWHFWNPRSGICGGLIISAILMVALSFLAAWVLKL